MKAQSESKDNSNKLIATVFLGLAGLALFFGLEEDSSVSVNPARIPQSQLKPEYTEKARKHLMMTADEVRFQEIRNRQEVLDSAPALSKTAEQRAFNPHEGLDLSSEDSAKKLAQELGRSNDQNAYAPETPDQLIQNQIFNQDQLDQYSQAYKAEYARQFVENARRGGYEVELTEDFRVLSVKKIRDPAGKSIFNYENGRAPVR